MRPPPRPPRRRPVRPALMLAAVLAAAAAADEPPPSVDVEAPGAAALTGALADADAAYARAAAARDRDAFARLLAPDAVFFAESIHRGRDAFLAAWSPLWDAKYNFAYDGRPLAATVAASGELGYTIGEVETRFQRPGLPAPDVTSGHYLSLWTRGDDGGWLLRAAATLVVHPRWGAARDPRSGLMTAWPELADLVDATVAVTWTPETTVRAASGELAYSLGAYTASFTAGATTHAGSGHYLAIWEKDAAGHWQLAAEGLTPPSIHDPPR